MAIQTLASSPAECSCHGLRRTGRYGNSCAVSNKTGFTSFFCGSDGALAIATRTSQAATVALGRIHTGVLTILNTTELVAEYGDVMHQGDAEGVLTSKKKWSSFSVASLQSCVLSFISVVLLGAS